MSALDKLAAELRAGLEGVTPGPWLTWTLENFGWNVVHYRGGEKFDILRIAKFRGENNAAHFGRCSPDNIAALLDERDADKAQIAAQTAEIERLTRNVMGAVMFGPPAMKARAETAEAALAFPVQPAGTDAIREEPKAFLVCNLHVARQPVKARGRFPEPEEYLYPARREADAREVARIMGGDFIPLYAKVEKGDD